MVTKLSQIIASFIKNPPKPEKKEQTSNSSDMPNIGIGKETHEIDEKINLTQNKNDTIELTDEFKSALNIIKSDIPFVFITGRAGTGKSTFIGLLKKELNNYAIVAPTGVAALNVGGQTIHSFFRIAPGPIDFDKITSLRNKIAYQALKTLIIDEISMVRADLMDAIDKTLRVNRNKEIPFGGVQVIAIGDLFQLPPVISSEEEQVFLLKKYKSPFFFSAKSFDNFKIKTIEFTKIFRQSEQSFIEILNNIREAKKIEDTLPKINQRTQKIDKDNFDGIVLTTTNSQAGQINTLKLLEIESPEKVYLGTISGEFRVDKNQLPAPQELILKVGSRVLFVKNDRARRWVNGTIGEVTELNDVYVLVKIKDSAGERVARVQTDKWENIKYEYNADENKLLGKVIGFYEQIPLTLAWAITIHKSQGKTFQRVHVDLGNGAFAEGQFYVALSRCTTLEGVTLEKPVKEKDIYLNYDVINFNNKDS